jgi:hypothetical protein
MSAPICVTCNKPLTKRTGTIFFCDPDGSRGMSSSIPARITSIEQAQRHTNLKVVSVRKRNDGTIFAAGVWDGVSYGPVQQDGLFCTNACAQAFGLAIAKRMLADGRIKR